MKRETRYDELGGITLMTEADGYVMVRRPGAIPFVLSLREWDHKRRKSLPTDADYNYRIALERFRNRVE